MVNEPRAPYRAAFYGAGIVAATSAFVLAFSDAIDGRRAQPTGHIAAPCRIERPGQIAQITVRQHQGELIATCTIFEGRKG